MLFCRHSIFLPALRIVLQLGNSSAMAARDHINIAVMIPLNTHRIIILMFATSFSLGSRPNARRNVPMFKDFSAEISQAQGLSR